MLFIAECKMPKSGEHSEMVGAGWYPWPWSRKASTFLASSADLSAQCTDRAFLSPSHGRVVRNCGPKTHAHMLLASIGKIGCLQGG